MMSDAEKLIHDTLEASLAKTPIGEPVHVFLPKGDPVDMEAPLLIERDGVSLYFNSQLRWINPQFDTAVEFRDCDRPRLYFPNIFVAPGANTPDWFAAVRFRSMVGGKGMQFPAVVGGQIELSKQEAYHHNIYGVYFASQVDGIRRVSGARIAHTHFVYGDGDVRPLEFCGVNMGTAFDCLFASRARAVGWGHILSSIGSLEIHALHCRFDNMGGGFTGALRCGGTQAGPDWWKSELLATGNVCLGVDAALTASRGGNIRLVGNDFGFGDGPVLMRVSADFDGTIEMAKEV